MADALKCDEDGKEWRTEDTVPYIRLIDGTFLYLCRKCVGKWIDQGFLQAIPFWRRKELANGVDG